MYKCSAANAMGVVDVQTSVTGKCCKREGRRERERERERGERERERERDEREREREREEREREEKIVLNSIACRAPQTLPLLLIYF